FTDATSSKIARITPSGTVTEFSIPTANSSPLAITGGPDGNLWFTEERSGKIGRITPAGKITEFPISTADSSALMITSGPDGNLWFTEINSVRSEVLIRSKIGRITPAGTITEFSVPNSDGHTQGGAGFPYGIQIGPSAITTGPDGNLWFIEA